MPGTETELSPRMHIVRGTVSILGGILIMLTIGAFYTFGNMMPYMATYMAYKDQNTQENYAWYSANGVWIFALLTIAISCSVVIGAKMELRIGPSWTCFCGCLVNSLGVLLTYFVLDNFYLTVLTYGILNGTGTGMAYATPMVVGMRWFPAHKGTIAGTVVLGFGCSSMIFTMVQTALINPENVPLDPETGFLGHHQVIERTRFVFVQLAMLYIIPQCIGCFLLRNPPSFDYGKKKRADREALIKKQKGGYEALKETSMHSTEMSGSLQNVAKEVEATDGDQVIDVGEDKATGNGAAEAEAKTDTAKPKERKKKEKIYDDTTSIAEAATYRSDKTIAESSLLYQIMFWNLYLTKFCNTLCVVYLTSQWKDLCNQYLGIRSDYLLALMGSVASIFNGFARLFWSTLLDYSTYAVAMGCLTFFTGLQFFCWPLVKYFDSMTTIIVFSFIFMCGTYFCISGNFSVLPTHITDVWGHKNNGVVYGVIFTSQIPAAFLSSFAVVLMREYMGWLWLTWLFACLAFVSTFCAITFKNEHVKSK